MRALAGFSAANFSAIDDGNVVFPDGDLATISAFFGVVSGLSSVVFALASVDAELADSSAASAGVVHWALRNSLHETPSASPALCAALYLTLHSFMLKAFAEGINASGRKIAVIRVANRRELRRSNMKPTLKID